MPARSLWQGSISFGLVNIPIKLYTATNSRDYVFNQLCQNGHRIRYKKWCPEEEREVPYSEIKKGYEVQKDNYIVFEKEELNKVKLKTTHSIDIKEFIEYKELDPILIDNSYYVATDPKKGNEKAYALLVKILNDNNLVAIGKVILKDRENVVALRPYQRGLVMHVLNYLDDMKPVDEIPEMGNVKSKLLKNSKNLLRQRVKGRSLFHPPLRRQGQPRIFLRPSRPASKPRRSKCNLSLAPRYFYSFCSIVS